MATISISGKSIKKLVHRLTNPNEITKINDPRELYEICEQFYNYTILGKAINKVATFPVASISVRGGSKENENRAKRKLRKIHLRTKLGNLGRNYRLYGIGYLLPMYCVRKSLTCRKCGAVYDLKNLHKFGEPTYNWTEGKYKYECTNPECPNYKAESVMDLTENENTENFRLVIIDPNLMEPRENEITNQKEYVYRISEAMADKIKKRDHFTLCSTPEMYLNAWRKRKRIRIQEDDIFVIEASTLKVNGIPLPPILMVLSELFVRVRYQAANIKIASDSLLPLKMIFPVHKNESGRKPLTKTIRLSSWKNNVEAEIRKWKKNKDYIPILPVEVGTKSSWGHGKLLALTKELESNIRDILAGNDLPMEFLYGGVAWSKQNVSSIILENTFKMESNLHQDVVDYVQDRINQSLHRESGEDPVRINIQAPRLVKEILELQFLDKGKDDGDVSPQTFYSKFGVNVNDERALIHKNREKEIQLTREQSQKKAIAQVEASRIMMGIEKRKREVARDESVKDALSQMKITQMNQKMQIAGQKDMLRFQNMLQNAAVEIQSGKQKEMMMDQAEMQSDMLDKQSKKQIEMLKSQMDIQLGGQVKQQEYVQKMQQAQESKQQQQQQQELLGQLSPEEKQEISQLPQEDQAKALQQMMQKKKIDEFRNNLPEEERVGLEHLPDPQQEKFLLNEMKEKEVEQSLMSDPSTSKVTIERLMKEDDDKDDVLESAQGYSLMSPVEREEFSAQALKEDTSKFVKIKNLGDAIIIARESLKMLKAQTTAETDTIWERIQNEYTDLSDRIYEEVEKQLFYKQQALGQAYRLSKIEAGGKEWQQIVQKLNETAPKEFRLEVFNKYKELVSQPVMPQGDDGQENIIKKSAGYNEHINSLAKSAAEEISQYDEKMQRDMLNSIRNENREMYKRIKEYL